METNAKAEMETINAICDNIVVEVGNAAKSLSFLIMSEEVTPSEAMQRLHCLEKLILEAENLRFN